MKCAAHPEAEAAGFCRNCGKPLCPECTREVRGALYCEGCLATMLGGNAAALPATAKSEPNPGLATVLGFIPGLGAVYNGEYIKALIHVLVFGGLIAILSTDLSAGLYALFGIALGAFYSYMPVDAYRVAKARREGAPEPASLVTPPSNKPIGAYVLIALGVVFLLANFGLLEKEWIAKGWPIGLIVLGVWLLYNRMGRRA